MACLFFISSGDIYVEDFILAEILNEALETVRDCAGRAD